ncbi:MAG TPA: phenylalanine--tRNA ligase subunit beta [Candidatus Thermoplasmatota archaeon]|nr:phenylalanine--tRNA ligase subunit beta [Candidatus Thermoplasmatota archaeon]
MPVVTFGVAQLRRLVGKELAPAALAESLAALGGEASEVTPDQVTMEYFPNRPDLLTIEGAARALRAFLGIRPGLPPIEVAKPRTELRVDSSVNEVRDYAALCFVRGVKLDDAAVQSLIDAQEKLTLGMGRRRRKVAIGLHDAAGLKGPFTYTTLGPRDKPFVPLGGTRAMTPNEIISLHVKGQEYGHLIPMPGPAVERRFPAFLDGAGEVLSLPPIINAQRTAVTARTRDILVDVTGTDARAVRQSAALLAANLAERGGAIEAVTVHDTSGTWTCPDLRPVESTLHMDDVKALLGLDLDGAEAAQALARMGHGAEPFGNKVLVRSPPWRFDLLHPVDILEDVAIGVGYDKIPTDLPKTQTFGARLPAQRLEDRLRSLLIGHGWSEAMALTLSDAASQWGRWGEKSQAAVTLRNPVVEEQTLLRTRLVPGLLGMLAQNRHRSLPQRLFEVGHVVVRDGAAWRNRLHLGVVEVDAKADFSAMRGLAESLVRDARLPLTLAPGERPGFIPGREGELRHGGRAVGHFGELHPETVARFGLGAATVALELELAGLAPGPQRA